MERSSHIAGIVHCIEFALNRAYVQGARSTAGAGTQSRGRRGRQSQSTTTIDEDDAIYYADYVRCVCTLLFGRVCALYVHEFALRDIVPIDVQSHCKIVDVKREGDKGVAKR